jgi:regulatory protein
MDEQPDLKKARTMALRYLTYRARTAQELEKYLQKKNCQPALVVEIMTEMRDYGYIDDARYAADYISYRKAGKYGEKRIRYELLNKGVNRAVVSAELENSICDEEELEMIKELIRKRMPADGKYDNKWFGRQFAYLARRGYKESLVMKTLQEYRGYDD